jgi:hypothetical protein
LRLRVRARHQNGAPNPAHLIFLLSSGFSFCAFLELPRDTRRSGKSVQKKPPGQSPTANEKSPSGAKPEGLKWKVLEVVATIFAACQCRRRNGIICAIVGGRTMNDLTITEPINVDVIRSRIITIRDVQVMLDRDLAELYGVEVGQLNRQVKRNIERFPHDFMFQLSREDCSRCQIGTLNGGRGSNIKYLPYAFTENGIAMLSSVLRSPRAIAAVIMVIKGAT